MSESLKEQWKAAFRWLRDPVKVLGALSVLLLALLIGMIGWKIGQRGPREVKLVGAPDAICVRYETQFWANDPEWYRAYQNFNWDMNWQGGAVAAYWKDPGVVISLGEPLDDDVGSVQGNWCWGKQPYEQVINHPNHYGEVELAPNWTVRQTGQSIAWSGLTLIEWNDEAKTERLEKPYYSFVVNIVMKTNPQFRDDVQLLCQNQTGSNGICDLDTHLIKSWDDEAWLCWMSRLDELAKNDINWRELRDFLSGILNYEEHMLGIEDPLWCTKHPYQCHYTGQYFCEQHAARVQAEEHCRDHPEACR